METNTFVKINTDEDKEEFSITHNTNLLRVFTEIFMGTN